jgi:imidazolonepropionase-like amidohydrolase
MNSSLIQRAVIAALLALPLCAQDVLAVKGGKVITMTGSVLEDATVLIENGRIKKVGKAADIEVPWAAKIVDATGKTVMPAYVLAHTTGGVRGMNEQMQNVPFVSIADAVDPANPFFEDCLRNGVGTVHVIPGNQTILGGTGMVVRPYGRTVEDMAVATMSGMKLSLAPQGGGRLQQVRKLRRAIDDVREYMADFDRRKAEFEKEKKAGAIPADKEWTEEYDRQKKPVVDLIQKKIKGWLYVPSAAEVPEAIRLTKELDLVLVLGPNMHKAVDELKALKVPVVLDETIEYYETDAETQVEQKFATPKLFADAGIPYALSVGIGGANGYPWWQLGTCVRNGVERQRALEAMTLVPARLLGLEDQVGSLAEGKLGNVQVLTGDPLLATTWVETLVLEGAVVYERAKDQRLKYLFQAPAKKPESAEKGEKKDKGDKNGEDSKASEPRGEGK